MILITKISDQTRQRGHTLSTCTFLTSPECLVLLPLLPCYSLDCLGRQLLSQPFLVYIFSCFQRNPPRFPHRAYNSCAVSCASSPLFRPPRCRPCSDLRYCSRFRPRSHPVFVHGLGSPPPSPFPRTRLPPRYDARVQAPGFASMVRVCVCVYLLNCT